MARLTFQEATVAAIAEEMRRDRNVFIMGEDIGRFGGPLNSCKGLWAEFGAEGRVIDTPISEGGFVGAGVGAALVGKRPIVDLMFLEFLGLVVHQFGLDGGAMHYYSDGHAKVPMVVRAKYGVGPFHGHAYDFHSWLLNVPGVKVVAPSNPVDAKGLTLVLLAAGLILEPVIILVVLVPLMIPTARSVGIDLIQLGVVSVLATLIGLIVPPIGLLIYLSAAQAEAPVHQVVRELLPFVAALMLLLALLVAFPELSLFLPRMVMG